MGKTSGGKTSKVGRSSWVSRSSKPRDKREINAVTFVLGGVFAGFYVAAGLTMATVDAGEMRLLDERVTAIRQEREQYQRALYDAELDERAEKVAPIMEAIMGLDERAEALLGLELEFDANQEMVKEEAERLMNLSTEFSCGGE